MSRCQLNLENDVQAKSCTEGGIPMKGKQWLGIWMAFLLASAGLAEAENGQGLILSSGIPVDALHFYEAAHPETPLEFADPLTADDLARYITTQDASIDIFVVKADYNFTQLKRKGYAAPLDASQALTASLAEMDESIAQVLLDESGALVAWPHELSIWEYGINEGYWEMFWPDRPLPKTFGEVLDAWIDWERNLAQDYPGVGFMRWEFDYAYLLETFVNLYVMQHSAEGCVDFDSPELKSVLQKLQEVYEIRLTKGRSTSPDEPDTQLMVQSETGPGCIFHITTYIAMSDRNPTSNQTPDSYLYGVSKSSITNLPLVFAEETVPYTNARMYVFVVNPYSTKIDAAIRFLECMAQVEANSRLYYAIHPDENEPYPRANYEQIRDSYTRQKAEYEEAIQQAKDANEEYNPSLETRVQFYEDWLADEGNRWQIKRETIEEFRQMVREYPLHLHAESPFLCEEGTSTYQLMRDACEKYASGLSSLDGFLAELSTKMHMVEAENL